MEVIEEKVESGGKEIEEKPKAKKESTKVIDLVAVLQESLAKSQGAKKKKRADEGEASREEGGVVFCSGVYDRSCALASAVIDHRYSSSSASAMAFCKSAGPIRQLPHPPLPVAE